MRRITRALAAIAVMSLSIGSVAHRGHGSWSEVIWIEDRFEITHQIHLADAIRLLDGIKPNTAIDAPEGLALLALHVEAHFNVVDGGAGVMLETIGAEIDDDFLYVFQEWQTSLPSSMPEFTSSVLVDIEPSAQAYIHYEAPGINQTLQLDPASGESPVRMPVPYFLTDL